MSAVIDNRHITCPHCSKDVTVLRPHDGGARYAKEWTHLPKRNFNVLKIWYEKEVCRKYWIDKDTLLAVCQSEGLKISLNSLNGRVSELLALALIQSTKQVRDGHETSKKPLYKIIDSEKTYKVLITGGQL